MSLRLSTINKQVVISSSPINATGSIDIPGYYQVNGLPINNQFYPALSTTTTEKAISTWAQGNAVPNAGTGNGSWNTIAWSPTLQLFAAVSQAGGGVVNKIATSPDGINWQGYKQTTRPYQGIVWCNDLSGASMFIATIGSGGNGNEITYSTDGSGWIDVSTPVISAGCGAVAYSPELKRVVAIADSIGFMYSNDGFNWTTVSKTDTAARFYYTLAWSPKLRLFAAISIDPCNFPIATSPDGINWTYRKAVNTSISAHLPNGGLAWSEELGIFCGASDKVLISSDGVNWFYYPVSTSISRNLTWSPQLRIFLAGGGTSVVYSYNGLDWFSKNIGGSFLKSSCWSQELGYFLVSGNNNMWRSNFAGRPPTSFNVFDSSYNNINQLGLWNFQSFGRGIPVTKTASFTVQPGENWIIINNSSGTTTVTLPTAGSWIGEEIILKNISTTQTVISASSNIVPLNSGTPGTSILSAASAGSAKWAVLVSDGTNWIISQAN